MAPYAHSSPRSATRDPSNNEKIILIVSGTGALVCCFMLLLTWYIRTFDIGLAAVLRLFCAKKPSPGSFADIEVPCPPAPFINPSCSGSDGAIQSSQTNRAPHSPSHDSANENSQEKPVTVEPKQILGLDIASYLDTLPAYQENTPLHVAPASLPHEHEKNRADPPIKCGPTLSSVTWQPPKEFVNPREVEYKPNVVFFPHERHPSPENDTTVLSDSNCAIDVAMIGSGLTIASVDDAMSTISDISEDTRAMQLVQEATNIAPNVVMKHMSNDSAASSGGSSTLWTLMSERSSMTDISPITLINDGKKEETKVPVSPSLEDSVIFHVRMPDFPVTSVIHGASVDLDASQHTADDLYSSPTIPNSATVEDSSPSASVHQPLEPVAVDTTQYDIVINEESKLPFCQPCDRSFLSLALLRRHIDREHIRPYHCELCKYSAGSRSDLERHRTRVHRDQVQSSGIPTLNCPVIGCRNPDKVWDRKDNLKKHIGRCRLAVAKRAMKAQGWKANDIVDAEANLSFGGDPPWETPAETWSPMDTTQKMEDE